MSESTSNRICLWNWLSPTKSLQTNPLRALSTVNTLLNLRNTPTNPTRISSVTLLITIHLCRSNVADSVGDVQSIVVSSQLDVSLLGTVWSDHGVDLLDVNLVQLLDGSLDLVLVRLQGHTEHQGVTVLDLLDGGLGGDRSLNDLVGVHSVKVRHRLSGVSWGLGQLQGSWQSEGGAGSHLDRLLRVGTLQGRFLSSSSSVWMLVREQVEIRVVE